MNRVSKSSFAAFALALFANTASAAVLSVSGQFEILSRGVFEIEDYSFDVEQTLNIGQPTQPVFHSTLVVDGAAVSPPPSSVTVYGRGSHRFDIDFADGTFFSLYGESVGAIGSNGKIGPLGLYRFDIGIDGGPTIGTGSMTIASVPELASWVMLLTGFGALGFASRRAGCGDGVGFKKTVRG
jgi:hypothetical protein